MNQGEQPRMHFFRDSQGHEIDLPLEKGNSIELAEIKSGQTVSTDGFASLRKVRDILGERVGRMSLVYGGTARQRRNEIDVINYLQVSALL